MTANAFAQSERAEICRLFTALGPEAATLCEGWTARDLAAHLWVRESDPLAAPGILLPPLAGLTERRQQAAVQRFGWPGLVQRIRRGPVAWSAMRVPALDALANSVEYFVHVEDVRRAQPGEVAPRQLDDASQQVLWQRLAAMGKLLFRRSPVGVVAHWGERQAVLKVGTPSVELRGEPGEVLLVGFGRGAVAQVEYRGDQESVAALRGAHLGV